MIDYKVTDEQIKYAKDLVHSCNFGQRGRGDGNREQQFVGILGQTVVADLLNLERPKGGEGFDGGYDIEINNKKVDIKTMGRTVPMQEHYVHNFIGYQAKYNVDYLIFCSFNKTNNILTICGYISKSDLLEKAKFYEEGTIRTRDNGTSFRTKAPLYEICQKNLHSIDCIKDILDGIR
ncbi:hypothetical protein Y919_01525 [Caloranaerobacter azorensis H53214]|uniref:Uncharacterized protein n=1 Tax=Caloranaerobacter azorensis H53214 TaxID=1156417 RepID=A0A096BJ51_9FIRM|nr:hypothetical protein [Caloranaerobacter azorensis]KGG81215.1 hypothetical protein Y919_01525 [Caloranaerobacter azorensis H53214]